MVVFLLSLCLYYVFLTLTVNVYVGLFLNCGLSIFQQEAFEKCWAHSPLRAAARRQFYIAIHRVSLLSHAATVTRRLRIDVHNNINDNNDNAWQRGPLWPHGMGPINEYCIACSLYVSGKTGEGETSRNRCERLRRNSQVDTGTGGRRQTERRRTE